MKLKLFQHLFLIKLTPSTDNVKLHLTHLTWVATSGYLTQVKSLDSVIWYARVTVTTDVLQTGMEDIFKNKNDITNSMLNTIYY